MELPEPAPDGEIYVTTAVGARLLGVADCTVSVWKKKGYVTPVGTGPRPLYRWEDLVEAEYIARRNAIRASGTDVQVKRERRAS